MWPSMGGGSGTAGVCVCRHPSQVACLAVGVRWSLPPQLPPQLPAAGPGRPVPRVHVPQVRHCPMKHVKQLAEMLPSPVLYSVAPLCPLPRNSCAVWRAAGRAAGAGSTAARPTRSCAAGWPAAGGATTPAAWRPRQELQAPRHAMRPAAAARPPHQGLLLPAGRKCRQSQAARQCAPRMRAGGAAPVAGAFACCNASAAPAPGVPGAALIRHEVQHILTCRSLPQRTHIGCCIDLLLLPAGSRLGHMKN
jgi:hypothetical protein